MVNENQIFVIEDEPSVAEVVSLYLRRSGFSVSVFHDGKKALEALENLTPALVVLDLMLPAQMVGRSHAGCGQEAMCQLSC